MNDKKLENIHSARTLVGPAAFDLMIGAGMGNPLLRKVGSSAGKLNQLMSAVDRSEWPQGVRFDAESVSDVLFTSDRGLLPILEKAANRLRSQKTAGWTEES